MMSTPAVLTLVFTFRGAAHYRCGWHVDDRDPIAACSDPNAVRTTRDPRARRLATRPTTLLYRLKSLAPQPICLEYPHATTLAVPQAFEVQLAFQCLRAASEDS